MSPCHLVIFLSLTSGCAPYQVGVGSMFRPDVRTVYVQVKDTGTFRRQMGERLWEAVVKEIEARTPYKVVNACNADALLTVTITRDEKEVLVENRLDEPREIQIEMSALVSWAGRQTALPLPLEAVLVTGNSSIVPEVGHSVAIGHQLAIQRLAQQIVDLMEIDPLAAVDGPPPNPLVAPGAPPNPLTVPPPPFQLPPFVSPPLSPP